MTPAATIGKNFEVTLRLINDTRSEWFIPSARADMDCATLEKNAAALLSQVDHWTNAMTGANRKSIENLSRILDNQLAKLDQYNALIAQQCGQPKIPGPASPSNPGNPAAVAVENGNATAGASFPWLLVGGVALVLILTLRK